MSGNGVIASPSPRSDAGPCRRNLLRALACVVAGLTSAPHSAHAQTVEAAVTAPTFVSVVPAAARAHRPERRTELQWAPLGPGSSFDPLVQATALNTETERLTATRVRSARAAAPASWWAPVASVLLPGAGQALLRQQRALAYVVAEAFMVIQASRAQTDFADARKRYRNIAADVARLPFGTDRPIGPWEYYETLASPSVTASGSYDLALDGKFTPEADEATYNGRQWLLARQLYWASPVERPAENSAEYQKALAFYQSRAVQGSFRWSWRDNQNAKELYVQTIKEANGSKQRGVSLAGLVAANHLLSLVDAYVMVRVRRYGGAGLVGASINSELRPSGIPGENGLATAVNVSVPIPRSGRRP